MHKTIDIQDLDIPKDDIECWNRYPKHRWVYDITRLFDIQGIKWSPFFDISLPDLEVMMKFDSNIQKAPYQPGLIYTKKSTARHVSSEVFIIKGDIKKIALTDPKSYDEVTLDIGDIELRLNAFVTIHFQKFTGIIVIDTYGTDIVRIRLKPNTQTISSIDISIHKLIKRIYKRTDITL